jgi:predicted DCC family thiol-disulfide oxidoreductase YuxK
VERIRALDSQGVLEYVPRDTAGLVERFPQLAAGDFNTGMRLITPDGTVYVGADSLYQVARRLRGWRRLAWLYRVPLLHALARAAYAWIARNRHRLHRDRAAG